ncbi:MAG: hypothetical protein HY257_08025, partial [Chloroflexi bacterium]|nr:hypothetical protein [Chloroflexota bacterium]
MSPQTLFTVIVFNSLLAYFILAALIVWKRPQLWLTLVTIFLGALVGWIDVGANEVILPVFLLLAFGFFIAFARPRSAWLHALFLAMWIPIFGFLAFALQVAPSARPIESFIAFMPAFIGAGAG